MKLYFFDLENTPYFEVVLWTKGCGLVEFYTTLREARASLVRLRAKWPNHIDYYIREFDSDGTCVRVYAL